MSRVQTKAPKAEKKHAIPGLHGMNYEEAIPEVEGILERLKREEDELLSEFFFEMDTVDRFTELTYLLSDWLVKEEEMEISHKLISDRLYIVHSTMAVLLKIERLRIERDSANKDMAIGHLIHKLDQQQPKANKKSRV